MSNPVAVDWGHWDTAYTGWSHTAQTRNFDDWGNEPSPNFSTGHKRPHPDAGTTLGESERDAAPAPPNESNKLLKSYMSDPDPSHFDVPTTIDHAIELLENKRSMLRWYYLSSTSYWHEAPAVIYPGYGPNKRDTLVDQAMALAIHVLRVLLDAVRDGHFTRPINIVHYANKFYEPFHTSYPTTKYYIDCSLWDQEDMVFFASICAFRIMLEVTEFMCVTAPDLNFGDGVAAYADDLFALTVKNRAQQEELWDPSHDMKRTIMQREWAAKMHGIDSWFPKAWEQLVARYEAYQAMANNAKTNLEGNAEIVMENMEDAHEGDNKWFSLLWKSG